MRHVGPHGRLHDLIREPQYKRLTWQRAGELVGATAPYICNVARGVRPPSLELAMRIEEVFGIPLEDWPSFECLRPWIHKRVERALDEAAA